MKFEIYLIAVNEAWAQYVVAFLILILFVDTTLLANCKEISETWTVCFIGR